MAAYLSDSEGYDFNTVSQSLDTLGLHRPHLSQLDDSTASYQTLAGIAGAGSQLANKAALTTALLPFAPKSPLSAARTLSRPKDPNPARRV